MRYYCFVINSNTEMLKESALIKLREYSYDGGIGALNNYMYRSLSNDISFFSYREEADSLLCAFSFNDKKTTYDDVYGNLTGTLNEAFGINRIKTDPEEITMYDFLECLSEARRRDYGSNFHRIVDDSDLWIFANCMHQDKDYHLPFDYSEKIVSNSDESGPFIYDNSLAEELSNILDHRNETDIKGNLVHYVISGRSIEATEEMTDRLAQSLIEANRLKTRRMCMIRQMEPNVYKTCDYFERIIENNFGGVVVFDLTEKLGIDPVSYKLTGEYIIKLLKKYRKDCLFVFTYNIDDPGFSYQILTQIRKLVVPVMIKEGSTDRKGAIKYLRTLIKGSEYKQYASQAGEFMKFYPGEHFSQTDILMAFEQFGTWSLNRNVLKAYDYDPTCDFMLDRDENVESSSEKLNGLIGLGIVKEQIEGILKSDIVEKERKRRIGHSYQSCAMHMIFAGNPGAAKTTVAKLFAGIAREKGILKSGAFVEKGGMDLCGLGCAYEIRDAFAAAKGGVLFIDEAYTMTGDTAIAVLIQEMENQRDNVIVILAGYSERMQDFMKQNEGLKSRIPHWIEFPDYDTQELTDIFRKMLDERGFTPTDDAIKEAGYLFEKARHVDNFGNGRYVRNIIEQALQNQAVRLMSDKEDATDIKKSELFKLTKEDISSLDKGLTETRPEGTAKNELMHMVGLSSVKEVILKAVSTFKLNKLCMEKGIKRRDFSLHMVFTGNPGTAKTTVARLFAEILKDEQVLSTGKFVEVSRADLVGDHVGSTAPLVKRKFKEAQGGVLFIDEAYSLCDSYENGFGDEAINTLVSEMENHRDEVIVIFAGYPKPMQHFLDRNPGMRSRIAYEIKFEDYTADELADITGLMLSQKDMNITENAMSKLRGIYERVCKTNDFGNGRFVRKMLEEAQMNLADRILKEGEDALNDENITTIKECDIEDHSFREMTEKRKLGFE